MGLWKLLIISILFWGLNTINGDTDPTDASALQVMFQSLNNPSQLSGWSASGTDPCGQSWKGVTCSGSRVKSIKISGLGLTGTLGYQLTSLTSLTELDVSSNNLGGTIEYNLPPKLERLNLAKNNFNGQIPYSISQMSTLKYLNVAHNQLNEQLSNMFGPLSSLTTLDLSYNSIPGPLPDSFSSLSSLGSLYLQNNQFTGTIDVLGNLPLQNLNIENNRFTGWIPQPLQDINIHKNGNSFNSGPAPPPPPGTPPYKKHSPSHNKNSSGESGDKKSGIGAGAIAGIVIALLVVGAIIVFFLVMRRRKKPAKDIEKPSQQKEPFVSVAAEEVQEEKTIQALPSVNTKNVDPPATITLKPPPLDLHKSFDDEDEVVVSTKSVITKKAAPVPSTVKAYSIADLQVATGSFSVDNLVGEGAIGSVYRAQLGDGTVLAVKKLDSSAVSSCSEDFTEIVSNASRLHHPNVSELVGYCSEHGQHLLVYEFHKKGSLHEFLHIPDEHSKPLSWNDRVKIALGSARALEYMHEVCSPSVIHKNFKSENILLDGELNPHVTDAGMATLLPAGDQFVNNNACAPEVTDSGQYTVKSDVFSFGVVMLELLSGRKPFDSSRARMEQSLVRWATPQLHDIDALTKMVDPLLEGLYPIKSLSRFADVIALCVQPEPEFRPPMSEVVQALVRLVQRVNMSKRTVGNTTPRQSENSDDSLN